MQARNERQEPESALTDAVLWGLPADQVVALTRKLTGAVPGEKVWAENLPAVTAFLAASTQWRTTLMPAPRGLVLHYVGLDYAGVRTVLDALQLALLPADWARLLHVEAGARAGLNGS